MKKLTDEEKQALADVIHLIRDESDKQEQTVRAFKWLANVPQVGLPYEQNKNVYELQDKAIENIKTQAAFKIKTIMKIINHNN